MSAKTLYEYYKSKGQKLPTIQERSKTFEETGLGPAKSYQGSFEQNVALLNKLQSQQSGSQPAAVSPVERLETQAPASSQYIKYQDSPHVYEKATGRYIPYTEAQTKNIWNSIETAAEPTPEGASPETRQMAVKQKVGEDYLPTNVGLFQQYQSSLDKRLQELQEREKKVLEAQENLPKKADLLTSARQDQGLNEDVQRAESLDERLANLEASLYESERDIRDRIKQSGGIVTESQVQRLVAAEKTPLIEEYNRLSAERQRLGQRISSKESLAREFSETQFEDLSRALGIAQTELEFGQTRYEIYAQVAKDLMQVSQADINQVISAAQSADQAQRQAAEDEINLALKLADLAVKTPAGTTLSIDDYTVKGLKTTAGAKPTQTDKDLSAYQTVVDQLEVSRGADGYVNTALYAQLKARYPQVFKWLPPEEWLNPNDPTAKKFFQTAASVIKEQEPEKEDPFELIIKKALEGK